MIGRAQTLERFGLAERHAPAVWTLRPGMEETLRHLGTRGDIIRTMHRAMKGLCAKRAAGDFAIHGDRPEPIIGRLVERGIADELKSSGYAIIDGIDGRVHHLPFAEIDATGEGQPGAVVELRRCQDAGGRERSALAVGSDLPVEAQVWLTSTLALPDAIQAAANAKGKDRYHGFIEALGRRLTEGRLLADNVASEAGSEAD